MDLSVIKDQLGDFATFVKGFGKLVENLPLAVKALGMAVNTFSSK
ncbi:PorH family porin [Corynebacterium argentoratense]|nr:PorH family porin [Corynebacterium argentoratense]